MSIFEKADAMPQTARGASALRADRARVRRDVGPEEGEQVHELAVQRAEDLSAGASQRCGAQGTGRSWSYVHFVVILRKEQKRGTWEKTI